MITPEDELRHPPLGNVHCNDSHYFHFYDAKAELGGFTRIGLRPSEGLSGGALVIFRGDKPVYSYNSGDCPLPEEDWNDLTVGELNYVMIEPLKKFRILLKHADNDIDLTFEGFTPVFDYSENVTPPPRKVATNHYEQTGTVKGHVKLGEERISFDGYSQRDHSWGVRDWEGIEYWWWITGVFQREFSFNLFSCLCDGRRTHSGFIFDGTGNSGLVDAEVDVEFQEDGTTQRVVHLTLEDETKRKVQVEGHVIGTLPIPIGKAHVNESITRFTMGDKTGYGIVEYLSQRE